MELFQLRYFVAVAEHLSFTRAAKALHLSQPPLSQQIKRLEDELGGDLFQRSSRICRLTDLGEAFLPRARSILLQTEDAAKEIRARTGLEKGMLRVGASGALAYHLLPLLIVEYRALYPNIDLHIVEHRTPHLLDSAERHEIDIALIRLPHDRTKLSITVLREESLLAVLPKSHPLAGETSVKLRQLREEPFILISNRGEPFHNLVLQLCAREAFLPNIICSGTEYATACRLVGLGVGVSILAEMGSKLHVEPSPTFIRIDDRDAISPIGLLSRPFEELSQPAKAFFTLATTLGKIL
ncbi:LysR family transcriptional regulator [Mesorhizobium sp. LjRoot246]|uniref:LysR family transcriptional regulator n=1 Tax=Mesorhizobium sp. LjRoot246 TaxID=3342294 RepID=UPI003ECF2DF4